MTKNQIEYQKLQESKRANRAQEAETKRANLMNEELIRSRDTATLDLRGRELQETQRSNQAREAESFRSNLARESENYRHNVAQERETSKHNRAQEELGYANISLGYSNLVETRRSNQANERIRESELLERQRSNLANEAIGRRGLINEFIRNKETERSNRAREKENNRSNLAREEETHRSNLAREQQARDELAERKRRNTADIILGAGRAISDVADTWFDNILDNPSTRKGFSGSKFQNDSTIISLW